MFTSVTSGQKKVVYEYHLCESCFRWMNLNTETYVMVKVKGFTFYAHAHCKPLKQNVNTKLLGGNNGK